MDVSVLMISCGIPKFWNWMARYTQQYPESEDSVHDALYIR